MENLKKSGGQKMKEEYCLWQKRDKKKRAKDMTYYSGPSFSNEMERVFIMQAVIDSEHKK